MSSSVSSLYSSMDVGEIRQDRLAINQKIQRHQSSRRLLVQRGDDGEQDRHAINQKIQRHQSSRRSLRSQDESIQEEDSYYETQPSSQLNLEVGEADSYLPNEFMEEDNDDASLALMQSALHQDRPTNFMPISRSSVSVVDKGDGYLEVEMGRKRRHNANNTPVIDIPPSLPQVFVDLPSVMRTQEKAKTEISLLYILLCAALLVSYAFFLMSCKLMNYGT